MAGGEDKENQPQEHLSRPGIKGDDKSHLISRLAVLDHDEIPYRVGADNLYHQTQICVRAQCPCKSKVEIFFMSVKLFNNFHLQELSL